MNMLTSISREEMGWAKLHICLALWFTHQQSSHLELNTMKFNTKQSKDGHYSHRHESTGGLQHFSLYKVYCTWFTLYTVQTLL